MNKSQRREVDRAIAFSKVDERMAASTIATLMRAASKKTADELLQIANEHNLTKHMRVVNGCYVA